METLIQGLRWRRCHADTCVRLLARNKREFTYSCTFGQRRYGLLVVVAPRDLASSFIGRSSTFRLASTASFSDGNNNDTTNRNTATLTATPTTDQYTGLFQLLNEQERKLLEEQKNISTQALDIAQQVGISTRDIFQISSNSNSLLQDYSTFSVVVAGEYNSGKSTLINALLGHKLLHAGTLPTTDCVTIVSQAPPAAQYPGILHLQVNTTNDDDNDDDNDNDNDNDKNNNNDAPQHHLTKLHVPLLQDLTLVDTPGTNAVWKDHTIRTLRLLPSADLILFVTSADRPFSESEKLLLESIAAYRKSIVIVINKMDILEMTGGDHGAKEKQRVVEFVAEHAGALLGGGGGVGQPRVLAVSSRDALAAKLLHHGNNDVSQSALWKRSNFAALERFLQESLTTETKLKTKLTTPLGMAEGLLERALDRLHDDRTCLEADVATIKLLQSQFQAWRKELAADMERIRNELTRRVELEGQRSAILLRRCSLLDLYTASLFDKARLRKEWDKTLPTAAAATTDASAGVQTQLLHIVQEAAESIATLGRAQGQAVIEFLGQRPSSRNQSLVGSVTAASRFEETRASLCNHLTSAVEKHVETDKVLQQEQENLLHALERTVLLSAGFNLGALGAIMSVGFEAVDLATGGIAGTISLASSAALLSVGKDRIATNYSAEWASRIRDLNEDLDIIFAKELDRVDRRVRDGVSPYTSFVEAEQERLDELTEKAENVVAASHRLRHRINHLM